MSKGQEVYQWVCKQPKAQAAIASLSLEDFRLLGGWLGRRGEINGVPGFVWSLCLVDSFRRLMDGKADRKNVAEVLG